MATPDEANELRTLTEEEKALNSRELAAYDYVNSRPALQQALSPDTQAKFFSLFLNGTSCEEIARLNKGVSLGNIVRARVEGKWDLKRAEHIEHLLLTTRERLQQISLESVEFVSNMLAAAHKLYGDKFKQFLQTGQEADLGPFSIHGLKAYKEAIELLKTITGQDKKPQKVEGEIVHTHHVAQPLTPSNRGMTPKEARQVVLDAKVTKKE